MKKSISLLATLAALAPGLPLTANADTGPCATTPTTQVYDLKTDWSDTQNPNGTWSYLDPDGGLLRNDQSSYCTDIPAWSPWGFCHDGDYTRPALLKTTGDFVPGHWELGDVVAIAGYWGVIARWTAPARGTINISGAAWNAFGPEGYGAFVWRLTHNGVALTGGAWGEGSDLGFSKSSPFDFSLGSGGPNALLTVPVEAGDHVELPFIALSAEGHFQTYFPVGLNFTITLTTDSNSSFAEDAIIWHQPLARNGASDDTDPSADRTIKYRFKRGSTIPIQIHAFNCDGADVTANANVIGQVTVFGDTNCDGAVDGNEVPIEFNGAGGGGGVMDQIGGHLKYNVDTNSLPTTTLCYILRVTVTDTSTGEEKFEEVLLQAK